MGFLKTLDETNNLTALRRHLGQDLVRLLPDQADFDEKRAKAATARLRLEAAERAATKAGDAETIEKLSNASETFALAEQELRAFSARPAFVYELPFLLRSAIQTATSRVLISTKRIGEEVIDAAAIRDLRGCLSRGVRVEIRVSDVVPEPTGRKYVAVAELQRLQKEFGNLDVVTEFQGKFFYLVCDDRFALVCNRSILGNVPKVKSFSHFCGFLLQAKELVHAYVARFANGSPR
jgi:hypothetical protein